MFEGKDAVIKSVSCFKDSFIVYLIPLFQDHVDVDKGQDRPTVDHCRKA